MSSLKEEGLREELNGRYLMGKEIERWGKWAGKAKSGWGTSNLVNSKKLHSLDH